ncbi:MAG UNVERIFIED_CONTAM: hypothetical protein LVR18_48020 [Planctomycetaceae bacterium]
MHSGIVRPQAFATSHKSGVCSGANDTGIRRQRGVVRAAARPLRRSCRSRSSRTSAEMTSGLKCTARDDQPGTSPQMAASPRLDRQPCAAWTTASA